MEPSGIIFKVAKNGREAVDMFQKNPGGFSAILMDVQMPIIAMTVSVFREDIEKCLSVGMNAHVGKPINVPELVSMLHRYL